MRHKHTRATRASHCFRRCHHCQHYHLLRIAIWIVLSGCELWVKEWHGFKIENYSLFHGKSSPSSTLRSFCSTFSIYSLCVAMWARHCCLELYWSTRASITQRVIVKSVELLWFCENRMFIVMAHKSWLTLAYTQAFESVRKCGENISEGIQTMPNKCVMCHVITRSAVCMRTPCKIFAQIFCTIFKSCVCVGLISWIWIALTRAQAYKVMPRTNFCWQ